MTIIALVPRVLSINFDETLGRGLRVNMAAFIIQQTGLKVYTIQLLPRSKFEIPSLRNCCFLFRKLFTLIILD